LKGVDTTVSDAEKSVVRLREFYEARASRQRVGTNTQRLWIVGAFIPVVISNQNAFEPTRDLYYAGALALDMVSLRYKRLVELDTLFQATAGGSVAVPLTRPDCIFSGTVPEALKIEKSRLEAICSELTTADLALDDVLGSARAQNEAKILLDGYKSDVRRLDDLLLAKDRDFRNSPVETIGAFASSVPRALDLVLTGTNVQQLVNDMKVQTAFSNMNMNLSAVRLPPLPAEIERPSVPSQVLSTVGSAPVVSYTKKVGDAVARYNYRRSIAREWSEAAAATELAFTYDPAARQVQVKLTAPVTSTAPYASSVPAG
jgi:hypothetical protein